MNSSRRNASICGKISAMKLKSVFALICLIALTAFVAGCGGDGAGFPSTEDTAVADSWHFRSCRRGSRQPARPVAAEGLRLARREAGDHRRLRRPADRADREGHQERHRQGSQERRQGHRQLRRPELVQQRGVRHLVGQGSIRVHARRGRRHQGLGRRCRRHEGRRPSSSDHPAGPRLRRSGLRATSRPTRRWSSSSTL